MESRIPVQPFTWELTEKIVVRGQGCETGKEPALRVLIPSSGTGESGRPVPNPTDTEVKSPQVEFVQSTHTIVLRQDRKKLGKTPDKWEEEVGMEFTGQ